MEKDQETIEISIHLEHPNTLKSLYPKVKHEHVSLSLSGELGDDDFHFLRGEELKEEYYDEDVGEFFQSFMNPYWDSIDLNLHNIIIPCRFFIETDISAYGLTQLEISNVQMKCEVDGILGCFFDPSYSHIMDSVTSILITPQTKYIYNGFYANFPNLKDYNVQEGSKYQLIDGVLFSDDKMTLVSVPPAINREEYEIPEGTLEIGADAFRGCHHLKSISIPRSVIKIGTDAFEGCENLEKFVVHPDNECYFAKKDVLYEYIYAWHRSDYPETIKCMLRFPPAKKLETGKVNIYYYTTQAIASHAFSGCKYITELNIGIIYKDNIDRLFFNIPNLKKLSVSSDVFPKILSCDNLEVLVIDGIQFIPNYYLDGIKSIKEYKVSSNRFHTIDGVVFSNHNELCLYPPQKETKIYEVPKDTTAINESAFYNAFYLEEVVVPSNINIISITGDVLSCKGFIEKEKRFETYNDRQVKIRIAD